LKYQLFVFGVLVAGNRREEEPMTGPNVTYVSTAHRQSNIRWRCSPHPGARLLEMPDLASIQQAIRAGSRHSVVKRIIIDGGATAADFLNFLAFLPADFAGDIVFVESKASTFLSAAGPEGRRVLYSMNEDDLDFYCSVFSLVDDRTLNIAGACAAAGRLERVKVLVAEDDPKTRELLLALVRDLGCEALVASSGLDAIKHINEQRPQVIFLDGLMPEMHGFEVARIVRKLDGSYQPRIVMLTGVYKGTGYRNEAKLRYGIDGYMVKPVSRADLASAIFDDSGSWSLAAAKPALVAV
jgi:CheY-like chemotaxis protein